MSRIRAPFLLSVILLLGMSLAAQLTSQPATPQPGMPQTGAPQTTTPPQQTTPAPMTGADPSPKDQARATIDRVATDLNLTADQRSKLEPILANEIELVHTLRADGSMTVAQKQAKFKDQLTADHAKIDAILTPEQKQKLALLNQQHAQEQQGKEPAPQSTPSTPPQTKP